ncbi:hypothetical protein BST81_23825 [Leptolyngbya sp. 'hensonii']|uniref:response regulator n=1 Tax=Leptolyngbya sp. 'hensonii' TaxID=1922337 RepID=UPI00094F71D5|nr:response regulator [Leptolyngbya sp. 'hensonii']OLP15859.1 hypothetical protein BST81_23825 [Leptolyngbya sp. 'hensonii']
MKILLVEDDRGLAELLHQKLTRERYQVELAFDGQAGWELAEAFQYDLILLDWVLPNLDGVSFCKQLREQQRLSSAPLNQLTPVILMTARDESSSKVLGLNAGADDYLVKPIDFNELLARMRVLLRRRSSSGSSLLRWESLCLDLNSSTVTCNEQLLTLTPKEYELLQFFLLNPQRIFSQSALIEHLWTLDELPTESTVRAHIKGLRQKLKKHGAGDLIETIYGLGYRLKQNQTATAPQEEVDQKPASSAPDSTSPLPMAGTPAVELELQDIWAAHQQNYLNLLSEIEQAVMAIVAETLTDDKRLEASRQAHTLVGSLGAFGLEQASRLAKQIEQKLNQSAPIDGVYLHQLLFELRRALPPDSQRDVELNPSVLPEQSVLRLPPQPSLLLPPEPETLPEPQYSQPDSELQNSEAQPQQLFLTVSPSSRQILQQEVRLLLVDDDPEILGLLDKILLPWGFQVILPDQAQGLWQSLEETLPDLLLLNAEPSNLCSSLMGSENSIVGASLPGFALCQAVRNHATWCELPILFLSTQTHSERVQQIFAAGADDYIQKPIVEAELVTRVVSRLEWRQMLRQLTETDELTGLSNRRRSTYDLTRLLQVAKRQNHSLGVVLLDLDYLQPIIDQHGMDAGNQVLIYLGQLLKQMLRSEDVIGYWDSGAFMLGLYGITALDTEKRIAALLQLLQQQPFVGQTETPFYVTASAGIAQYPEDGQNVQKLYEVAHTALYQAKSRGQNQVATIIKGLADVC